ncbi:MAG: type II toxin-antitoxin system PemK/MazF family toxin [Treponema sp.]|jgi:mRNA interferase MazF|nr:type II toxin-antitoxin system PemK/MazF family toxin [Treponema sp.]
MKQGEIWLICLDPTVGAEINKSRPALIINVDSLGKLPLKIIAPITDWKDHYNNYPWMVKIVPNNENCLSKASAVDCFQIRSVSVDRFISVVGAVDMEIISNVQEAVAKVIGAL